MRIPPLGTIGGGQVRALPTLTILLATEKRQKKNAMLAVICVQIVCELAYIIQ